MVKKHLQRFAAAGILFLLLASIPATAGSSKELAFAVSLARKGLWREASHRFSILAEKHPHNPRIWNNLAVAYEASGRFEDAHRAYQQALSLGRPDADLESNHDAFQAFYETWKQEQSEAHHLKSSPSKDKETQDAP